MTRWMQALVPAPVALMAADAAAQGSETHGRYDQTWWLPENVATTGAETDLLFYVILIMTMVVGIAVFACLIWFLIRYRHKPGRQAVFIHGNNRLELAWTLIPTIILALTAALSQNIWAQIKNFPEEPTAEQVKSGEVVVVDVIGKQFKWYFHYPGADGILGRRDPLKVDLTEGTDLPKLIGLDRESPGGEDDFVTAVMVVPQGRKVFIRVTSLDVLHSFFLPNFRIKQDAVPGMLADVWFEATKLSADVIGRSATATVRAEDVDDLDADGYPKMADISNSKPFEIVCAELCGQGHYTMAGQLYVLRPEEYQRWYTLESKRVTQQEAEDFGY